jgi:hypothetical protein
MAFWLLNKETNEARIFGSVSKLCEETTLGTDNMYRHFGRNKEKEYNNPSYRIVSTEIEKSKRTIKDMKG